MKARDEVDGSRIPSPITVDRLDFGEPSGRLELEIVDSTTGKPVTARISLQRQGGKTFAPTDGALYRLTGLSILGSTIPGLTSVVLAGLQRLRRNVVLGREPAFHQSALAS